MPYSDRDGVESDKEVSYLRYLISGLAINNTVIIVPANVGFIAQALNFNCRVRSLGVTNVLFWALDETAAEILRSYSAPTYYNPSFFSVANLEKYHALNYNRMMSERPKFWRMVMRTGYNMLFMDADIAIIRNPIESIVGDADLEGQTDDYSVRECNDMDHLPAMCAGAFFLKSSERSVALLNHMERQLLDGRELCEHPSEENKDIPRACEDQEALNFFIQDRSLSRVVNRNLNDTFSEEQDSRLTVRFIPVDEYLNGHVLSRATLVSDPTTMAFKDAEGHKGEAFIPAMVHVNGYTGKDKQERLTLHGWWHLNADFTCSYEKDIIAVDEGASLLRG
jgi:Nucleotide-diphospho-sugar transferase